jgi:hypothetical protein
MPYSNLKKREPIMHVRSYKRLIVASFALMIGLAGCASAGGGGSGGGGGGNTTRLTAEELTDHQDLDLFQVIRQLRARWLTSRGRGTPVIVVDGTPRQGGTDELRSLRVSDVQELRYLSASDATTRFGTGYEAGAILVTTRRR